MKRIKNLVFDLGGVIMNLDVPKTIKEFEVLGIKNIVNETGHHYTESIFYDLEIGKVSEDEFLEKLKSLSSLNPTISQIRDAWNAMILDMPRERIEILIDLKKRYNIFLLSNTNSIHQLKFLTEVNEANDFIFNELFQKAYYSHEIGIRKPNVESFEFVLNDSNLNPSETLFLDDSLQNIDSAKSVGMEGCLILNGNLKNNLLEFYS